MYVMLSFALSLFSIAFTEKCSDFGSSNAMQCNVMYIYIYGLPTVNGSRKEGDMLRRTVDRVSRTYSAQLW